MRKFISIDSYGLVLILVVVTYLLAVSFPTGQAQLFRQAGKLIRSKVALLQSKRLYPDELEWDEETPLNYMRGFGRLFQPDEDWADVTAPRQFNFSEHSRYKALVTGLGQYKAITEYEKRNSIPVYYLLYNPTRIPSTVVLPISPQVRTSHACEVGCRVVPASQLRAAIAGKPEGSSPAYRDLTTSLPAPFDNQAHCSGWRLEHFVVNLLLECDVGYIANSPSDGGLNYIFNRRVKGH